MRSDVRTGGVASTIGHPAQQQSMHGVVVPLPCDSDGASVLPVWQTTLKGSTTASAAARATRKLAITAERTTASAAANATIRRTDLH